MSYFIFDNLPSFTTKEMFIDIFMIIICVIFGYFSVKFRFYIYALKVLFIVMFCVSCINIYKVIEYVSTHKNIESNLQTKDSTTQSNISKVNMGNDPIFAFSKTQKNILVIVLDQADGYYFKDYLQDYKDLFSEFSGFTYYDNGLSTSGSTLPTLTSIIAGKYYSAYNINMRNVDTLKNEIARGYAGIFNAFNASNYATSGLLDYPLDSKYLFPLLQDSKNIVANFQNYRDYFNMKHRDIVSKLNEDKILLSRFFSISVFKFSPYTLRPAIYKKGKWFFNVASLIDSSQLAILESFIDLISNNETKPTFKFFHFSLTHPPFIADSNCNLINPDNNAKRQTEICAIKMLNKIIKEMKKLEIYDNTEIFITSDHGIDSSALPIKYNLAIPMFYKPYSTTGELKRSSENIINYDIATIFCSNIKNLTPCPNVDSNILENNHKNREILTYKIKSWEIEKNEKNKFILSNFYIFKGGNIYDSKNWQEIKEIKEIQNLDSINKETK